MLNEPAKGYASNTTHVHNDDSFLQHPGKSQQFEVAWTMQNQGPAVVLHCMLNFCWGSGAQRRRAESTSIQLSFLLMRIKSVIFVHQECSLNGEWTDKYIAKVKWKRTWRRLRASIRQSSKYDIQYGSQYKMPPIGGADVFKSRPFNHSIVVNLSLFKSTISTIGGRQCWKMNQCDWNWRQLL
jgi:hypothetical protein